MGLSKLKLSDINDADLSQLTITYKSWGQVWSNHIEISGDGCCTVSACFDEKQLRLSQRKVISLLNKIVSCGFFELKESRPNFSVESKAGKLTVSQFDICDGLSQSLTLRIGNKQRCFESYFDSCTAMDRVFKQLDKLIAQAKKIISMWFPINASTLNMGSDTSVEKYPTHPCHIVTNERLDKIRSQFECDFKKINIQLPVNLQTWGKLYDDSGFEVIYSLGVDLNHTPYLNYASHHRMAGSSSVYLLENGDSDAFDFDEEEDAMMRLCGIADNWEYNDALKPQEPFHHFWENSSPFSQWHKCSFHALGLQFNSAEQYMMLMKALLHNDIESAEKIMATSDVRKQKELGRQVKNFNNKLWFANCRRLVYEANKYKFTQDCHLLNTLLDTEGKYLVEASPYDTIWGIGLAANDPHAHDPEHWKGKNWLGEILTLLREDIKYAIENSPEWEQEETIGKPLNDWQYKSFLQGYTPSWDFRYAPRNIGKWHYITRSGHFVKKLRYEQKKDGLYYVTEHYTSDKEKGRDLLLEMLHEGYFNPPIWDDDNSLCNDRQIDNKISTT